MIRLSKRMKCLTDMVSPGKVMADIGCDHGLVSVYLAANGISPRVIAMDVAEGPLKAAEKNVAEAGMSDKIELRLSDGFKALSAVETDGAIIAGMGGHLILDIIRDGEDKFGEGYQLVLSPQSDVPLVRNYLRNHSFKIVDEEMIHEDGKFYIIIKAVKTKADENKETEEDIAFFDTYSAILIEKKSPVYAEYLSCCLSKYEGIFCRLSKTETADGGKRLSQVRDEIKELTDILDRIND